ncbi:MAG: CapA family protein [Anaerolineae bacterium]|nr:CapA family protein [Anaerolineae bacterium]
MTFALFLLSTGILPQTLTAQIDCGETGGMLTRENYRSDLSQTNMYYTVYTPPCYATANQLYPVIYLMHGSNDDDGAWGRLGLKDVLDEGIAAGTVPPLIVVMPFGEWIANENQFESFSWENVFLTELLPMVEASYRIDARKTTRAIGGISRGGFWAFEIAFRHPELFSAVGGHSAFFDDYHAPPEFNPLRLAQTAPALDTLRIWLDRGKDDFAAPGLDLMDERLRERGISFQYTVYPEGQHYFTYWQQHVAEYIAFYVQDWLNAPAVSAPPALVFATNTPAPLPTPEPTQINDQGNYLFLPAVAFPSLQATINYESLMAIRSGINAAKLVLDESTAAALQGYGVPLPTDALIVPLNALENTLWRDRSLYTLLPFERLTSRYRVLHIVGGMENALYDLPGVHPLDSDLTTYPFAFQSTTPNFYRSRLTRLLLSGVTALTRNTRIALNENGVSWAGEAVKPYTERADFFHTSNEVSFSPGCPSFTEQPLGAFCSEETHFDLLTDVGLDIVELTGNHNNDYGTGNYLTTLDWYAQHNMRTLGGGVDIEAAQQPLILSHNGNTIAMIACNWVGPYYAMATEDAPGAATCDWEWLREALPKLKAENDLLIVTVQYLELEEYVPSPQQQSDFRGLADLGADVVIGTQAHKPQIMEFYNARTGEQAFVHYGLGNLFFDQPFWGNMRFFMDQLFIYEGRLLTVDLFTGIIDDLARPRPMTADEQINFLAFMFNTNGGF